MSMARSPSPSVAARASPDAVSAPLVVPNAPAAAAASPPRSTCRRGSSCPPPQSSCMASPPAVVVIELEPFGRLPVYQVYPVFPAMPRQNRRPHTLGDKRPRTRYNMDQIRGKKNGEENVRAPLPARWLDEPSQDPWVGVNLNADRADGGGRALRRPDRVDGPDAAGRRPHPRQQIPLRL